MNSNAARFGAYVLPKTMQWREQSAATTRAAHAACAPQRAPRPWGRALAFDLVTLPSRTLVGSAPALLREPAAAARTPHTRGLLQLVRSGVLGVTTVLGGASMLLGALIGAVLGRLVSMVNEEKGPKAAAVCVWLCVATLTSPLMALDRVLGAAIDANAHAMSWAALKSQA